MRATPLSGPRLHSSVATIGVVRGRNRRGFSQHFINVSRGGTHCRPVTIPWKHANRCLRRQAVNHSMSEVIWQPSADRIRQSPLRHYLDWLERREGREYPDHTALWQWSVTDLTGFWSSIVDYYDVGFSAPANRVLTDDPMPDARWFPGARLNWAEHMLRRGRDGDAALICVQEGGHPAHEITFAELREQVAAMAGWLRGAGVRPGDPVAAYLPNTEHAVIGVLATAAVGATWACLFTRLRAGRHHRPARPARTDGAHRDRRLPLERQGPRPRRRGGAVARQADLRASCRARALRVRQARTRRDDPVGRGAGHRSCAGVRAGGVLPSVVGVVHLGNNGPAERSGAQPWRDHSRRAQMVRPVRRVAAR
ncbi:putative acetoacetyl-CoA synthetase [Gordonia amarae NBRC 15530]|uniref:Putative acetoacetyl-CoA synthetase n=1 Tax=Gordonia amarae NBRC 15530 TaxID=1075090 RepID=G7GST4_9ACTN|nr:putative acetoacetyl-CoA synthetase [Gordonia amarae NBRC 15530]